MNVDELEEVEPFNEDPYAHHWFEKRLDLVPDDPSSAFRWGPIATRGGSDVEIRSIDQFLDYLPRIRKRTQRIVDLVPDDRLDWRPDPDAFSFADLLRHLAALERYMFAENVRGRPSRYPGHGPELAEGPEEVRALWRRCRREALALYGELTDADLERPCTTPAGAELRTWKWLRAMIEHEVHHRGQLYLMLRMVSVETPPLYGLTSEEVFAHSENLAAPLDTPSDPSLPTEPEAS